MKTPLQFFYYVQEFAKKHNNKKKKKKRNKMISDEISSYTGLKIIHLID